MDPVPQLVAFAFGQLVGRQKIFHLPVVMVRVRVQKQPQRPFGVPIDFLWIQTGDGFFNALEDLDGHDGSAAEHDFQFPSPV
jgi:hypothetical protein